jgi:hypothetical protein
MFVFLVFAKMVVVIKSPAIAEVGYLENYGKM